MIEVFKTNVEFSHEASLLVEQIQERFAGHKANFDLGDCDRILRIKSTSGSINARKLIDFVASFGFIAEVLPDEPPVDILLNHLSGSINYSGY